MHFVIQIQFLMQVFKLGDAQWSVGPLNVQKNSKMEQSTDPVYHAGSAGRKFLFPEALPA